MQVAQSDVVQPDDADILGVPFIEDRAAVAVGAGGNRTINGQGLKVVSLTATDSVATVLRYCVQRNAQDLIAWILHQEFERFLLRHRNEGDAPAVVRNGFQPARRIMTGLGMLTVRYPKARSRDGRSPSFRSQFVPKYAHRARDFSDAAEWDCLDAVLREDFFGILRAIFGSCSTHVIPELPEIAGRWLHHVQEWKRRSLVEHCHQPLWMVTVMTRSQYERDSLPVHVAISGEECGLKRIVGIAAGNDDSPAGAWKAVVLDLQERGLSCPGHISSNWVPELLIDGLQHLEPRWSAKVVRSGVERIGPMQSARSSNGGEWPVPVHQN